jgi:hypothetical protein
MSTVMVPLLSVFGKHLSVSNDNSCDKKPFRFSIIPSVVKVTSPFLYYTQISMNVLRVPLDAKTHALTLSDLLYVLAKTVMNWIRIENLAKVDDWLFYNKITF